MNQEYTYDKGQLLVEPNTYFYTKYYGWDFIEAWRRSRDMIIEEIKEESSPPQKETSLSVEDIITRLNQNEGVLTEALLDTLYGSMNVRKVQDSEDRIYFLMEKLLKRFEVTKRIYTGYTKQLRPKDPSSFQDAILYVRFAEVLEAAFSTTGKLQYLNALLKCIDILSAIRGQLGKEGKKRLVWLLKRERHHIMVLAGWGDKA